MRIETVLGMRPMAIGLVMILGCGESDSPGEGGGGTGAGDPAGPGVSTGVNASGTGTSSPAGSTSGSGSPTASSTGSGGGTPGRLVGDEWFASVVDQPGDAPLFGFNGFGFSNGWGDDDMSVMYQTGGPLGRPFVRQDLHTDQPPEFGGGWTAESVFTPAECSWGCTFFMRFSYMPIGSVEQKQKIIILNRGDVPNDGRLIVTVENWGDGYAFRLQKDGGEDPAQYPDMGGEEALYDIDTWSHIQVEARYSSAPGAADGLYRLWVNNNDQGAPDAERTDMVLLTTAIESAPNFFGFSGYHQSITGPRSFAWTDVRVGPTFDPTWTP